MSKQPPAELAAEQYDEVRQWARGIELDAVIAYGDKDYAAVAHLHRALAGVMRNYQRFRQKQAALQADVTQRMIDEAKKEDAGERT